MTKKGTQIIPRRSNRQKALTLLPLRGQLLSEDRKKHTVAQGSLRQLPEEVHDEEPVDVRNEEPEDVHDEDPDAWRYVQDPEDELEKEDEENDYEEVEEAVSEKDKENTVEEAESEPEVEKEQEECLTYQSKNKKRRTRGPTKMKKWLKGMRRRWKLNLTDLVNLLGKAQLHCLLSLDFL